MLTVKQYHLVDEHVIQINQYQFIEQTAFHNHRYHLLYPEQSPITEE